MTENDVTLLARAIIKIKFSDDSKQTSDQVKALISAALEDYHANWYGTLAEYVALGTYKQDTDYYIIADFEVIL